MKMAKRKYESEMFSIDLELDEIPDVIDGE